MPLRVKFHFCDLRSPLRSRSATSRSALRPTSFVFFDSRSRDFSARSAPVPLCSHSHSINAKVSIISLRFLQDFSIACYAEPCISYGRDVSVRLSVCLSVRPSHAGTESKRRKLGSRNLHRGIAQWSVVFGVRSSSRNSKGFTPSDGVK